MSIIIERPAVEQVDVRGPRFAAWITTAVLIAVVAASAVSSAAAAAILAAQAAVFAVGALRGPRSHPYGLLFRRLIAPRVGPATEWEPTQPLRFAQFVGFIFALIGVAGFVGGAPLIGVGAGAFALAAAFLNAAFGICLGCQIYPLVARLRRSPEAA